MEEYDKQKFISSWEKKREQGKFRFILRMALWNLIFLIAIFPLLDLFEVDLLTAVKRHLFSAKNWLGFSTLSLFLGWFNWWMMERSYRRLKSGQ